MIDADVTGVPKIFKQSEKYHTYIFMRKVSGQESLHSQRLKTLCMKNLL